MAKSLGGIPAASNPVRVERPVVPAPRAAPATARPTPADGFSARTSSSPPSAPASAAFMALVGATQAQLATASGYVAEFGAQKRSARAVVEGQADVELSLGDARSPSFHAEAGKPLTVKVDPARIASSAEKAELVWHLVPGGEEHVVALSDGRRDATGRLHLAPAQLQLPDDAFGLVRLSLRTTSRDGKVSSSWDPSNDAQIAPREGATVSFGDDWKTSTEGALRAGDSLRLDYDPARMTAMNGGVAPSKITAFVSFNGNAPVEVPLTLSERGTFVPSIRIPIEATRAAVWFRGDGAGSVAWDSAEGKNFQLPIGPARDDADPSWKSELLRSTSFPNLKAENFVGIGPSSQSYNCIAWTLGIQDQWVWPGTRVEDFDKLYAAHGYRPLDSVDLGNDPHLEKIVVYGLPPKAARAEVEITHGARMDEQGRLTSKIGTQPLIRHASAQDLTGPSYGEPVRVYVRPRTGAVS